MKYTWIQIINTALYWGWIINTHPYPSPQFFINHITAPTLTFELGTSLVHTYEQKWFNNLGPYPIVNCSMVSNTPQYTSYFGVYGLVISQSQSQYLKHLVLHISSYYVTGNFLSAMSSSSCVNTCLFAWLDCYGNMLQSCRTNNNKIVKIGINSN